LWQAVTPEPHWCTVPLAACVPEQCAELGAQLRGGLEAPVTAVEVVLEEAVQRAGDVPGGAVQRLDLAAEAFAGAGVDQRVRPSWVCSASALMVRTSEARSG